MIICQINNKHLTESDRRIFTVLGSQIEPFILREQMRNIKPKGMSLHGCMHINLKGKGCTNNLGI